VLTERPYAAHSMRQMLKRRLKDAGLPELFSPHSFRVTVVTHLLSQDVPVTLVESPHVPQRPQPPQLFRAHL
jgi:integrase